jgi:hypothetical protein
LARPHGPEAIKALVTIMRAKKAPWSARSAAAQAMLDRGFGRPMQQVRHDGDEDAPPIRIENLSEYQLEMLIVRLSRG